MIAADRFPIDQSERPFNGSRPNFAFSILEFSRVSFLQIVLTKKKKKVFPFFVLRICVSRLIKETSKESYRVSKDTSCFVRC